MASKINSWYGEKIPPALPHVIIYFDQKGLPKEFAQEFFRHYKSKEWKTEKGCPVKNWKVLANNWIWKQKQQQRPLVINVRLHMSDLLIEFNPIEKKYEELLDGRYWFWNNEKNKPSSHK